MQTLEDVLEEVGSCTKCPGLKPCKKMPMDSHANKTSQIMIINQYPDEKSHNKNAYWSNPGGEKLRDIFTEIGIDPESSFYITDALKCLPSKGYKPSDEELINCRPFLEEEIEKIKPDYIIPIGDIATKNLFEMMGLEYDNILKLHNENGTHYINLGDKIIIPIQHPSKAPRFMDFVLYRYHLKDVFTRVIEVEGQ